MMAKINSSALFSALVVTLIYVAGWVLFSTLLGKRFLFSMADRGQPAIGAIFISILYLAATTLFVFILIKKQVHQNALLLSRLELADETLESRVKIRTAELESSLNGIKTLKGIIPICAHCKSIRNRSGQWEQIESYIKKHSEAEFSHGLCPDCDKELYGDRRSHFEAIAGRYV